MIRKPGKLTWCIPALLAVGCADESRRGEATQSVQTDPDVLTPADLTSSALTTTVLNATNAAGMGGSAAARRVLASAIGCALDSSQTVTFTVSGNAYSYTGGLGIATNWTSSALSSTQAAWVSACVFAHANDQSAVVWLSVRGSQSGLSASGAEATDYQIEEGAFWGNAFVNLGSIAAYTCDGVDQAANDSYGDLPYRQCTQWNGVTGSNMSLCDMIYAGNCSAVCSTSTAPYAGCSFQSGASSGSVVTIFLEGTPQWR